MSLITVAPVSRPPDAAVPSANTGNGLLPATAGLYAGWKPSPAACARKPLFCALMKSERNPPALRLIWFSFRCSEAGKRSALVAYIANGEHRALYLTLDPDVELLVVRSLQIGIDDRLAMFGRY